MHFEIVDTLTGKSYTGSNGVMIVVDSYIISSLQTPQGEFIVEKCIGTVQLCVATKLYSLTATKEMIESLLPYRHAYLANKVNFDGFTKLEGHKETESFFSTPDAYIQHANNQRTNKL
jgi:hypothetical protein